ncbi:MAG: hypothetical protein WC307_06665, partial [Candidatus Nanoarchaeia archaeon]
EEELLTIDNYRSNTIDGSNTTFYINTSWSNTFLFDRDGDGSLTTSDIVVYAYNSSTDTRSTLTVSSISEEGKFVLSSAPASGLSLYVTYRYSRVSLTDPTLKTACILLSNAFAYLKIGANEFDKITMAELKVAKTGKSFDYFNDKYEGVLYKLQHLEMKR